MTAMNYLTTRRWRLGLGAVVIAVTAAWVAWASDRVPAEGRGLDGGYAIEGIVRDDGDRPVGGASVEIESVQAAVSSVAFEQHRSVVVTGDDGRFRLDPGTAGLFTLVVTDTRHCPVWVQNVAAGARNVTFHLDRAPSITGQVLVYHSGRQHPLAGMEVRARLVGMDSPIPVALASDRITVTDAQGRFRFAGLGAQLRDGQFGRNCPSLAPTLTWRVACGRVGDSVTVRPTDREVDIKLVLFKDEEAAVCGHRLISCTHRIGRGQIPHPGL